MICALLCLVDDIGVVKRKIEHFQLDSSFKMFKIALVFVAGS